MALYAYIACDNDNALTIIDISNPTSPTLKGSIQGVGSPNYLEGVRNVYVLGSYAYVAAGRLVIRLDPRLEIHDKIRIEDSRST